MARIILICGNLYNLHRKSEIGKEICFFFLGHDNFIITNNMIIRKLIYRN